MATTLFPLSGSLIHTLTTNEQAFGAIVRFFDGGTTTPKIVYADSGENTSLGSEVSVDGNARMPNVFVPTGLPYDYRVIAADGTTITQATNVPNPTPGEGGGTPPPAEEIATGTPRWFFETGEKSGWVRINGRTIGSSVSGATERANDDTEALFTYVWDNIADAQAAVVGGRGASAAADWAANKQIALPDMRGASVIGADDMGNTAGSFFPSVPFTNGDATTIASIGGYNSAAITIGQLPLHNHTINISTETAGDHVHGVSITTNVQGSHLHSGTTGDRSTFHNHSVSGPVASGNTSTAEGGTGQQVVTSLNTGNFNSTVENVGHTHDFSTNLSGDHSHLVSGNTASNGTHSHTISGQSTGDIGAGDIFSVANRFALVTWYIKL